jgi:hypothetical protein
MSGASTSAVARQTGTILNQFLGSQFYYDTQKAVQAADSFEVFQKGLKDFHLNTGESRYELYKTNVMKVFDEVMFAWISSPLFHDFMENAHNMLYYQMNWADPQVFTEQEVGRT